MSDTISKVVRQRVETARGAPLELGDQYALVRIVEQVESLLQALDVSANASHEGSGDRRIALELRTLQRMGIRLPTRTAHMVEEWT